MNKLIVLSGVPGSGKSYFTNTLKKVRGSHVYIVSSDSLREMTCGNVQDMTQDHLIWKLYYKLAEVYSLDENGVVVLDSTSLKTEYRLGNAVELKKLYSEIDLVIFKIDKAIVMNQNLRRDHPVPPAAIEQMYQEFEEASNEEIEFFDKILYIKSQEDLAGVISQLLS